MAKATLRIGRRCGIKIRELGEQLRRLEFVPNRSGRRGPDMRLNDGWSAEADAQSRQEYGDNGDCWWPGAIRTPRRA